MYFKKVYEQSLLCNGEMTNKRHILGKTAEVLALLYLCLKGYRPLKVNDHSGGVEGDIIAQKGSAITVVEVKWRQNFDQAHRALHPSQRQRLQHKMKVVGRQYKDKSVEFHLVLICPTPPFIQHIKNPFSL